MIRLLVILAIASFAAKSACASSVRTGTGFSITFNGILVTNHHVVEGCTRVRARGQGARNSYYEVSVMALDSGSDLAAIRLEEYVTPDNRRKVKDVPRAILRESPPLRLGDQAITYGFPMQGLLASGGNLTVGYVTALQGLGDNPNYVQISTPVQPGNSGGALLDSSGNVIGVVAAKLDASKIMRATGDIPQNVNFAIQISSLRSFLTKNNISIVEESSTNERSMKDIAARAQLFTYLIECESSAIR